jgi:hypothetical protein
MSYSIPGAIVKGATFQIYGQTQNDYTGAIYLGSVRSPSTDSGT